MKASIKPFFIIIVLFPVCGIAQDSISTKALINDICVADLCLYDSLDNMYEIFGEPDDVTNIDNERDSEWAEPPQKQFHYGINLIKKDSESYKVDYDLTFRELKREGFEGLITSFTLHSSDYSVKIGNIQLKIGNNLSDKKMNSLLSRKKIKSLREKKGNGIVYIELYNDSTDMNDQISFLELGFKNNILVNINADYNLE